MGYGPISNGKQLPITPWTGSWAWLEERRRKGNPCTLCGGPGIPGLIQGAGKCQAHWNRGAFGTPLPKTVI